MQWLTAQELRRAFGLREALRRAVQTVRLGKAKLLTRSSSSSSESIHDDTRCRVARAGGWFKNRIGAKITDTPVEA